MKYVLDTSQNKLPVQEPWSQDTLQGKNLNKNEQNTGEVGECWDENREQEVHLKAIAIGTEQVKKR